MKTHPNSFITLSIFLAYLLIFSACSNNINNENDALVFRYNEHANITSLDPAFAKDQRNIWACNQLFNGLVQLDHELIIQPDIASRWTISKDGRVYTFFLRKDIYFHKHILFGKDSTRSLTANDVVYSLNRLTNDKLASPGSWLMQQVTQITAPEEHIVEIKLTSPFPAFLGLLANKHCSVVPKEIVENVNFSREPIGTGPFYFKRWEENEKLVFRRYDAYHEKDEQGNSLPYLESVAITFLPDKQSEFLQFAQKNIDFISGLDPSYKDELLTAGGQLSEAYVENVYILKSPYLNTEYLGIHLPTNTTEIQSLNLRKAINYGFDRRKMIKYLRNGIGIPGEHGMIPKGLPGFNASVQYDYQPEKAKKLVRQYQQETRDKDVQISITCNANYLNLVEYIQRELQKIGIDVAIDVLPPSTIRQQRSAGKLPIFRASWIADYPDAENYLSLFHSANLAPNGPNYTHYQSKTFDSLYDEASMTTSSDARSQFYKKMDSLVMCEAPVVVLYYDEATRFISKKVSGLGINPINLLDLKRVRKSE
ncbi:ABC transporter substrate-binding protein [Gangjinia marincola]|uniref:ABC transporter substrate-binding protein n=1 Tax=Gangjinia marincola TaxID=578463 RepID=A0ABP3XU76_9FLAO